MSIIPKRYHGVVYRNTDNLFSYNGWPSITKCDDGSIAVACSGLRLAHICPYGKSLLFKSMDEGKTWSVPAIINDTYLDDRDTGIVNTGDGSLLLTWFSPSAKVFFEDETYYYAVRIRRSELYHQVALPYYDVWRTLPEEEVRGGSFVRISNNNGITWSEKITVPVTAPHGPAVLADGSLLYLGNNFPMTDEHNLSLYKSEDKGRTWYKLCDIDDSEVTTGLLCEPHCLELPSGRILAAFRYEGEPLNSDGLKNTIFTAFSDDGGKTFSKPQCLGLEGVPPHLMLHSSGAVILSYGRRKSPFGERAVISKDGGETWSEEYEVFSDAPHRDLGYPATIELKDGSLLTVYYQRFENDECSSILYTHWHL